MFDNALSGFKLDFECGAAFWHFNVHIPVSMASLVQHRNGPSNYFLETAYNISRRTEYGIRLCNRHRRPYWERRHYHFPKHLSAQRFASSSRFLELRLSLAVRPEGALHLNAAAAVPSP
jgi:hypothetical protein